MDPELFSSENYQFLNCSDLFCEEQREKDKEYIHLCTVLDHLSIENSEFGQKAIGY